VAHGRVEHAHGAAAVARARTRRHDRGTGQGREARGLPRTTGTAAANCPWRQVLKALPLALFDRGPTERIEACASEGGLERRGWMLDAREEMARLVEGFARNIQSLREPGGNEARIRLEYIDPL